MNGPFITSFINISTYWPARPLLPSPGQTDAPHRKTFQMLLLTFPRVCTRPCRGGAVWPVGPAWAGRKEAHYSQLGQVCQPHKGTRRPAAPAWRSQRGTRVFSAYLPDLTGQPGGTIICSSKPGSPAAAAGVTTAPDSQPKVSVQICWTYLCSMLQSLDARGHGKLPEVSDLYHRPLYPHHQNS